MNTTPDIDALEQRAAALPAIDHRTDIWRLDSGGHNIVVIRSAADANNVLATFVKPTAEMLVFITQARAGVLWLVSELRQALGALRVAAAEATRKEAEHATALEAAHEAHRGALAQVIEEHGTALAAQRELAEASDSVLREEIETLKNKHSAELSALYEKHGDALLDKEQEHLSAIEMLKLESQQASEAASAALASAVAAFDSERAEQRAALDTLVNEARQELAQKAIEHEVMLATIREEHVRILADKEAALQLASESMASITDERDAAENAARSYASACDRLKADAEAGGAEIERLNVLLSDQHLSASLAAGTIAQLEERAIRATATIEGLRNDALGLENALVECRRSLPTDPAPAAEGGELASLDGE